MDQSLNSKPIIRNAVIGSPNTPESFIEGPGISIEDVKLGYPLEAASFDGKWYNGKIVFVDYSDATFLVHFDGWNVRFDEWYKFTSKKVRPFLQSSDFNCKKAPVFKTGENVLARWVDDKFYRCYIVKAKLGDSYEVRFEDGVLSTVDAGKIRRANKVDEYSESIRLVKQQESIERAKNRDLRLQRRCHQHNELSTLQDRNRSTFAFISEIVELEEGLRLSACVPLSDISLLSGEVHVESPHLTLLRGKTFSFKSHSSVLGNDHGEAPDLCDDASSYSSPSISHHSGVRSDSPCNSTLTTDDSCNRKISTTLPEEDAIIPSTDFLNNPDTPEFHNLAPVQLAPLPQTSPPLLSTPISSYNNSLSYTETVMTTDGRVLTFTPSYQASPPLNDLPPQPLYYQLVPIRVTPPNNPSNLSIQPADQSYLSLQQPYSYPIQTQYTPLVQQMHPSSSENIHQLSSTSSYSLRELQPSSNPITDSIEHISSYTLAEKGQQLHFLTQEQTPGFSDSINTPSSIHTQTPQLLTTSTQQETHSEHNFISDSESDYTDRALCIDISSANLAKFDTITPGDRGTICENKSPLSEEEGDSRELRKLRLPDHDRKVAPLELVTTLENKLHICEIAGCGKQFRRREGLKKHLTVFHSEVPLAFGQQKSQLEKPLSMSPLRSPVLSAATDPSLITTEFPSNSEHSITNTELLFRNANATPNAHRSKRKSSQPKKSSFHEPTTPTVTIIVPPELGIEASEPQTSSENKQLPVQSVVTNATPSRQSKRIRIKKNWTYESRFPINERINIGKKTKSTLISERPSKQHKLILANNSSRGSLKTPNLLHGLKEKATVKIKTPKEQIVAFLEEDKLLNKHTASEAEELKDPVETTEERLGTVVEVDSDREITQVIGEMEVEDSQLNIIDLVETSVIESPDTQTNTEIDSTINSDPTKGVVEIIENIIPVSQYWEDRDKNDSTESETDENKNCSNSQEQIECVCGFQKDEGVMVQCEQCLTWQHTCCIGLSDKDLPDQHICHSCSDTPALIKRELYKHNDPWFKCGKLFTSTDADMAETGAQLNYLKSNLRSIQALIPSLNLKISIAMDGSNLYLEEFKTRQYQMLSSLEISDKVAEISSPYSSLKSEAQIDSSLVESQREQKEDRVGVSESIYSNDIRESAHSNFGIPNSRVISESIEKHCTVNFQSGVSEHLRLKVTSNQLYNPDSDPEVGESVTALQDPNLTIPDLYFEGNLDSNISPLMSALNETNWGCQMRLFHSIGQIQSRLISQCSSIENSLSSLQFRIPNVEPPLKDMLVELESIPSTL